MKGFMRRKARKEEQGDEAKESFTALEIGGKVFAAGCAERVCEFRGRF